MDINFLNKSSTDVSHYVVFLFDGKTILSQSLNDDVKSFLSNALKKNMFKKKAFDEDFTFYDKKNNLKRINICKLDDHKNLNDYALITGKKLHSFEKDPNTSISVLIEENPKLKYNVAEIIAQLGLGFYLKNYSFDKYKTTKSKKRNLVSKISFCSAEHSKAEKIFKEHKKLAKGVFFTRDLVSEPANVLYPEKFVEYCNFFKKAGLMLKVFDEKKINKLGMDALMGVAKGSVRPPRVLIMEWNGLKNKDIKNTKPLAFVGKGVTFDTGGISLKPSGGMEDMKWDMGGSAVVAGLMLSLAERKAKVNAVGIVGLVENMPDGNAQRPGDVVKSMSGQTIEVLNTDAEGRLVLADILWYVNTVYKPKLIVDLATLTGAIIVALGDRYAGLFSNDDSLSNQILESSKVSKELVWRLPLDSEFDKLLNCEIADMRNITNSRGAGSITAAQFLKRFIGKTPWAHLDIAGVTWSKKNTALSRTGGTGFGVRLLDEFVRSNHEKN